MEAKKAIRPISHSAFQETVCTTVYKRDGNSDAFLGDTKCEGIPVEVSLSLSLSLSMDTKCKGIPVEVLLKTVLVAYSQKYRPRSVFPEGAHKILLSGFFR